LTTRSTTDKLTTLPVPTYFVFYTERQYFFSLKQWCATKRFRTK